MSTSESTSGGDSNAPSSHNIKLPTPEETERQIAEIAAAVPEAQVAVALQTLVQSVIVAVTKVDESHNVGLWLKNVLLICHGPGDFEVQLELKNTTLNPASIVMEASKLVPSDYHKLGRAITLQDAELKVSEIAAQLREERNPDDERTTAGLDVLSLGEVPGG